MQGIINWFSTLDELNKNLIIDNIFENAFFKELDVVHIRKHLLDYDSSKCFQTYILNMLNNSDKNFDFYSKLHNIIMNNIYIQYEITEIFKWFLILNKNHQEHFLKKYQKNIRKVIKKYDNKIIFKQYLMMKKIYNEMYIEIINYLYNIYQYSYKIYNWFIFLPKEQKIGILTTLLYNKLDNINLKIIINKILVYTNENHSNVEFINFLRENYNDKDDIYHILYNILDEQYKYTHNPDIRFLGNSEHRRLYERYIEKERLDFERLYSNNIFKFLKFVFTKKTKYPIFEVAPPYDDLPTYDDPPVYDN